MDGLINDINSNLGYEFDGEIIAKGNHKQMLNTCEDYRKMYKIYIETYFGN